MSVENFDQLDGALAFLGENTPDNCFYCGKPLAGIGLLWYSGGKAIGLHVGCGARLGSHLIKDSLHAERIEAGKPVVAGIGVGLVANGR
jgi:hypothetical protein